MIESKNDSLSHVDDGGADKSGDRRRRRWLRNLLTNVFVATSGVILLIVVYRILTRSRTSDGIHTNKDRSSIIGSHQKVREKYRKKDDYDKKPEYRFTDPIMLPPVPLSDEENDESIFKGVGNVKVGLRGQINRLEEEVIWDDGTKDWKNLPGPATDYTKIQYGYPDNILIPPRGGSYPPLEPLGDLMKRWPQDDVDSPPQPFVERLQHFDYQDPVQMEAAVKYRDLEYPFKVYNVPEILAAGEKWTDGYLSYHFDHGPPRDIPRSKGHCQQSVDSFFAFFNERHWNTATMGPPPTLNNDFNFERWAKHARYADAVGLPPNREHFYWQAGVQRKERLQTKKKWGFISRDLPSFSDPNPTFFGFNPPEQHGIQCRFGERGLAAATHYDGGRNMIAMITGAKRYILSPPIECGKLGISPERLHPMYRHSLLNFGHVSVLDSDEPEVVEGMSRKEREWLEISRQASAVETVLKAGEVLYTPSHWFHYIISLQKSAQCNTRSGKHTEGSVEWGGEETVMKCEAGVL